MEACPVCRASLNGASTCRRCRADLQKVQEIERRGQTLVGAAMLALAEGDVVAVTHWLDCAQVVHATPAVRALRRLVVSPRLPDDRAAATCPPHIHPERAESQEG